jgi:hypothetical protein
MCEQLKQAIVDADIEDDLVEGFKATESKIELVFDERKERPGFAGVVALLPQSKPSNKLRTFSARPTVRTSQSNSKF